MVHRHKLPSWIEASVPLTMDSLGSVPIQDEESKFIYEFFYDQPSIKAADADFDYDDDGNGDGEIANWVIMCGNLAVMMSLLVTFAPIPTVMDIYHKKNVGTLPLLPFTLMIMKAFIWFVYGSLKSNKMLWIPNLFSLPLGIGCFCIYTAFSPQQSPQLPGKVNHHVFLVLAVFAITTLSTFVLPPWIAKNVVGVLAVGVCVVRDWSPLVRLADVIRRKNADAISAPMSIVGLIDCALWCIFGKLAMNDKLVYWPNGVRFGFTAIQVGLIIIYGSGNRESTKRRNSHPLKRTDSDVFDGLLNKAKGEDEISDDVTLATIASSGSARSVQMREMQAKQKGTTGGSRRSALENFIEETAANDKKQPVRHRHHEV